MKKHHLLALFVALGLLVGLLLGPGTAAQGPSTQLVMILDGSGSISSDDWTLITDGLADAIENPDCIPHDGSVELTVIQFSTNAKLEVGPVVITSANASSVATQIRGISQMRGRTCIACGFCLAQDVLLNYSSHYNASLKQALNLVTDGEPNRCADCADCTGAPNWECPSSDCPSGVNDYDSAEAAQDSTISQLGMTSGQDEIDAEFIGTEGEASEWLKNKIVWPQPGSYAYDPPFTAGWVRVIPDAKTFADTVCEKITEIVPTPTPAPVGGIIVPVNKVELLAPWLGLAALMVAAVAAAVVRRRRA